MAEFKSFKSSKVPNNVRSVDPNFSNWLIELGDGQLSNTHGLPANIIEIPARFISTDSIIKDIFGETLSPDDVARLSKMAFLCPKNSDVDMCNINQEV